LTTLIFTKPGIWSVPFDLSSFFATVVIAARTFRDFLALQAGAGSDFVEELRLGERLVGLGHWIDSLCMSWLSAGNPRQCRGIVEATAPPRKGSRFRFSAVFP
jgi:hypothetical protein